MKAEKPSDEPADEHEKDVHRKREKRSAASHVEILDPVDINRRERALRDPELFLKTYGRKQEKDGQGRLKQTFYNPFVKHHLKIIDALYQRAMTGGDKAVAAPRGDGKSSIVLWMLIFILCAGLRRHPVVICRTLKLCKKEMFNPVKWAFAYNPVLAGDFPEISCPVQNLDGAPARAAKQHVNGEKTHIVWKQDELTFPHVDGSPYGGMTLVPYGFDSAIRGERSDFAVISDPEDKFSAKNVEQNKQIEDAIDSDVAGLAFPNSTVPRVVITTIQNRRSYSYRVTSRDPKEGGKPTFEGERYGILEEWPTCWTDPEQENHWETYIALRQQAQADGDKDGLPAVEYYDSNKDAMHAGAKVTNPYRFDDSNPAEKTALQAFFNRVADWGLPKVLAELQNNPEAPPTEESLGLTAGLVQRRVSGLAKDALPKADCIITYGCDVGKYWSNWVKVAWHGNAIGNVIDYGVIETPGMESKTHPDDVHLAIVRSLIAWRTDVMAKNPPDFGLTDSGTFTEAVYEAIRQCGGMPFAASKGGGGGRRTFRMPEQDANGNWPEGKQGFLECYSNWQHDAGINLFHFNSEYWKHWVQERFLTPTFDEHHQYNAGSLSLFSDTKNPKRHHSFSHHIVAEGREEIFVEGKGKVRTWMQYHDNNHWLDAMALACAAAGVLGVRLVGRQRPNLVELERKRNKRPATQVRKKHVNPGSRFRKRKNGWVKGLGNRRR